MVTAWSSVSLVVVMLALLSPLNALPNPAPPPAPGSGSDFDFLAGYDSMCRVMCARKEGCPMECSLTGFGGMKKRTPDFFMKRKFSDFSHKDSRSGVNSFDDYLFMRLLGRNLGE